MNVNAFLRHRPAVVRSVQGADPQGHRTTCPGQTATCLPGYQGTPPEDVAEEKFRAASGERKWMGGCGGAKVNGKV